MDWDHTVFGSTQALLQKGETFTPPEIGQKIRMQLPDGFETREVTKVTHDGLTWTVESKPV